ncbi:MAG: hypothetical protein P8I93_09810 [Crocinitomicaceae bacterium]|nr:hypothetical protein [Crocinitomicaceae bacterium]
MEDKSISIFKTKSFQSLSKEEKKSLSKWCETEEDFNEIKNLFVGVDAYKNLTTKKTSVKTKESLDELFNKKHLGTSSKNAGILKSLFPPFKPFYLQTGFQIAALLVVAILIVPKFLIETKTEQNKLHSSVILKKKELKAKKSIDNQTINKELETNKSDKKRKEKEVLNINDSKIIIENRKRINTENEPMISKDNASSSIKRRGDLMEISTPEEETHKPLISNRLGAAGNGNINGTSELESSKELLDQEDMTFTMEDNDEIDYLIFKEEDKRNDLAAIPISKTPEILELLTALY